MSLKQTFLFPVHQASGAKMVDFGGWEMPVSYGSQIEEHHAVRQNAGMFDVSHMLNIDLVGTDARSFLRYLLANDVARLTTSGKALYTCMLNPEGGVIDDLIVYFFEEDKWRIVVNAATAEGDIAWMNEVAKNYNVSLTPRRDLAMIAVQGPHAREKVTTVRPEWKDALALTPFNGKLFGEVLVARTGYTGEDGFEVVLPGNDAAKLWQDLAAAGVQPCGLGARDTLRLEAGMNLYGQDMNTETQPYQSGLAWTVSLKDENRDFIGKSALLNHPRKNAFLGLKLEGKGVMRAHMPVYTEKGEGETTSGTMSPTMGVSIAFARLPEGVVAGDKVEVGIRDKRVPAVVCTLPFVRNGQIL
ncbi:glycine cleavage system aminomethyltransferase GcvT [Basilea psittacipulmonis]|uniref:Aminomethyltransferase n=1 Tax=Basilea psittacipulmonis DSM 24701 TaxID=1072685 RepID=A0A077DEG1_9BURK|nr:glycine cleavage system aminomethyltransferase GcvT [Basilea psittacipulmonis]AIL32556.1 glycine cleavage system protein T [Basilea psittacipulmonis DSM 24701]